MQRPYLFVKAFLVFAMAGGVCLGQSSTVSPEFEVAGSCVLPDTTGLACSQIRTDHQQRWILVGFRPPPDHSTNDEPGNHSRWFLIDSESWKVVGTKDFSDKRVEFRFCGGKPRVTIEGEESEFELSIPKLDAMRPVKPPPANALAVADRWYVAGPPLERWNFDDSTRVPFPQLFAGLEEKSGPDGTLHYYPLELLGRSWKDRWISEGVLYDPELNEPQLLLRTWGFIRSQKIDVTPILRLDPYVQHARNDWKHTGLKLSDGSVLKIQREFHPVTSDGEYRMVARRTANNGRELASMPIRIASSGEAALAFQDGFLFAHGQLLEYWSVSALNANRESQLRFEPKQSSLEVSVKEISVLTHKVVGGQPPYQFTVEPPQFRGHVVSTQIDKDTGDVRIDGARAAEVVYRTQFPFAKYETFHESIESYMAVAESEYEELIGAKTSGIPVQLGMTVTATDAMGDQAKLPYHIFLQVSSEDWFDVITQRHEKSLLPNYDRMKEQEREFLARHERTRRDKRRDAFGLKPLPPLNKWEIGIMTLSACTYFAVSHVVIYPLSALFLYVAARWEMGRYGCDFRIHELLLCSFATNLLVLCLTPLFVWGTLAVGVEQALPPIAVAGIIFGLVGIASVCVQMWANRRVLGVSHYESGPIAIRKAILSTTVVSILIGLGALNIYLST